MYLKQPRMQHELLILDINLSPIRFFSVDQLFLMNTWVKTAPAASAAAAAAASE